MPPSNRQQSTAKDRTCSDSEIQPYRRFPLGLSGALRPRAGLGSALAPEAITSSALRPAHCVQRIASSALRPARRGHPRGHWANGFAQREPLPDALKQMKQQWHAARSCRNAILLRSAIALACGHRAECTCRERLRSMVRGGTCSAPCGSEVESTHLRPSDLACHSDARSRIAGRGGRGPTTHCSFPHSFCSTGSIFGSPEAYRSP